MPRLPASQGIIVAVVFGLATLTSPGRAAEDDAYRGRTINLIVSTDAGTGYDVYARTIARHWQRHIPGNPSIIVQNMSGAGGLRATNLLFNVAPKDGLTLGLIQSTVPFEPLFGNKQAMFDPRKFNWLGTPGQETSTVIVWHTVPVQTIQDAKKRGLTLAATGRASTPALYARVITALLGVPINIIAGYKSQNEVFLSMERGEHEGSAGTFYSTLKANKADWLSESKIRVLLQYGSRPNPELKGVPFALDLIPEARDRQVMEIASRASCPRSAAPCSPRRFGGPHRYPSPLPLDYVCGPRLSGRLRKAIYRL